MAFRVHQDMEQHRVRQGPYASDPGDPFGAFYFLGPAGLRLGVLASDGKDDTVSADLRDWEHVSVSTVHRVPTWEEMCGVRDLFWEAEDCIVQFHPAKSQYVNYHPYTLHLWRHRTIAFPTPPAILVGPTILMGPTST